MDKTKRAAVFLIFLPMGLAGLLMLLRPSAPLRAKTVAPTHPRTCTVYTYIDDGTDKLKRVPMCMLYTWVDDGTGALERRRVYAPCRREGE